MTQAKFETIKWPSKSFTCRIRNSCDTCLQTVGNTSRSFFILFAGQWTGHGQWTFQAFFQLNNRPLGTSMPAVFISEMKWHFRMNSHCDFYMLNNDRPNIRGPNVAARYLCSVVSPRILFCFFLFGDPVAVSITADRTQTSEYRKQKSKRGKLCTLKNGTINAKTENGKQSINSLFRSTISTT